MSPDPGVFITLEGIEGCGKSTQARRLADHLNRCGISALLTREPGGTPLGRKIRDMLLDARNKHLPPLAELFLYEADRALHVEGVIQPALDKGMWVICDRFFDATTVYQGHARGLDMPMIRWLNEKAASGLRPDKTVLLDCPVEVGLNRARRRIWTDQQDGQDRFEQEQLEFHHRVREGYLHMAAMEPDRYVVVDGTLSEDDLAEVIFQEIHPLMSRGERAAV